MNDPAAHDPFPSPVDHPPETPPMRVVSLVPSLTETLFDLDLGDRLVAATKYCRHPANKVDLLRRVGGTKDPDVARIIELRPDMVLLNDEENRRADADALHEAGIPLWVTGPRTVFDVLNLLWNIMAVFDHGVMSARVREIERAYDYSLAAAKAANSVRVFAPIWRGPWMTFNNDTYAHDVLRVCGGENVFADYERGSRPVAEHNEAKPQAPDEPRAAGRARCYPTITLDELIAAQPEIILLPDEPYAFGAADAAELVQLDVPAAHERQIYHIDGSLLTWHGTRVAYALRDLPELLMGATQAHDSEDDSL